MKTHRIFGIMLVTGKPAELDKVEKLAAGTHFLTAYGDKRGRRVKVATPLMDDLSTDNWMDEPNPLFDEVPERCMHGKGLTEYCEPCGRTILMT